MKKKDLMIVIFGITVMLSSGIVLVANGALPFKIFGIVLVGLAIPPTIRLLIMLRNRRRMVNL